MLNVKLYGVSVGPVAIALAVRTTVKPAKAVKLYVGPFCPQCGGTATRRFCPQCGAAMGRV